MTLSFILRDNERGHDLLRSDGTRTSCIAGYPDAFVTRASSFTASGDQGGRAGFGSIRVFGDEFFHGAGCGYNMHPHHDFVICAFVLEGELTHINTADSGTVDRLRPGDYYVFSAGSGGKLSELSVGPHDMNAIYLWVMPDRLHLPPSYRRARYDRDLQRDRIHQLIGDDTSALPVPQDLRVSRLIADAGKRFSYRLRSRSHGVYAFVLEGAVRLDGNELRRRDSAGIGDLEHVELRTIADATDLLIVETLMIDDEKIRYWETRHAQQH